MSVLMFTRAILIATAKKLLKQCKSYISKKLNKKFKKNNNKLILMSGSIWIRNAKKC